MYRSFFAQSPVLAMPVAAMMIFLVVFLGIVVATLRRKAERDANEAGLPLDGGEGGEFDEH